MEGGAGKGKKRIERDIEGDKRMKELKMQKENLTPEL